MSASKKRPPTTRLVGDAPVLIEGERGVVLVKGEQASFPAPAIEPPADDRKPTAPFNAAPTPKAAAAWRKAPAHAVGPQFLRRRERNVA
jgi:hypothetical protein